jgi:very-short-patch-repair endonuclease
VRKKLIPIARRFRKKMTDAEFKLWEYLRNKQLGVKFRRQCPIDNYVVDFLCFEKRLIVEVDGGQHAELAKDKSRDKYLKSQGFKVLRFWNNDVLSNTEGVIERIIQVLDSPPPYLPRQGGGN